MIKLLDEDYLDKDEKFWDYKTKDVDISKNDIFDIGRQETGYGQDFIDMFDNDKLKDYLQTEKNKTSEILYMSPNEYYNICAKRFNTTVDNLKEQRAADKDTIKHLEEVITKYHRKFPLCYIDYTRNASQEGLHRMMVAGNLCGWDTKFPVLIIKWYDEERAKAEKDYQKKREYLRILENLVDKARRDAYYKDTVLSELEETIKEHLSDYFDDIPDITVEDVGKYYKIAYKLYPKDYELIDKSEIEFWDDEDTDDVDDIDLDNIDLSNVSVEDLINMSDEEFNKILGI